MMVLVMLWSETTGKGCALMLNATVGRYHIIRELGRGGMGIVYLGQDPVLERPVAIKILSRELVANADARDRFIREAQSSARLNHPGIVGIYDISEQEGIYYLVFEYVPGLTLDQHLGKRGILPLADTLKIIAPICQAIAYAHHYGIVHRDIKPANIIISEDGKVKVADFGVAAVESATTITQPGEIIGTLYYMSPEQASGGKLDRRSDIYSLGVVLYEMLTGQRPFRGESPAALIQQHLTMEPPPLTLLNLHIPRSIELAVLKALQKSPSDRYQTAQEFLDDLTVEEISRDLYATSVSPAQAASHNLLGNSYFKLGKLDLAIIEWEKATSLDPYNALIHNNLGTAYDGMGTLDKALTEYEKAAMLNPSNYISHYNLGSAYYRAGEIERSVEEYRKVTVINVKFAPAFYNLGNGLYKLGKTDEAIDEWHKALIINPQFPEVLYNLGNALFRKRKKNEAYDYWTRTVEQDPHFAIALYNMGVFERERGNGDIALELWNRCLEVNPEFAECHYNIGRMCYDQGDTERAIASWERAVQARYGFWVAHYGLGNAHYRVQNIDEAISHWKKAVEFKDDHWQSHWNLANALFYDRGHLDQAIIEWQKVVEINPQHWQSHYNLGEAYLSGGRLEHAVLEWDKVIFIKPDLWIIYHNLGCILYQRGKVQQAVAYWTRAIALMLFTWEKQ
jgi:serine/threonine protein kinase/lipopolysaccharide biosynthesis regulator YciM